MTGYFEHCLCDLDGCPILQVKSSDGRHFELTRDFDYVARDGRRFRAPIGGKSDGCSTPPEIWNAMGVPWLPPFGKYWPAAFIHDGAYQNWLLVVNAEGICSAANLSKDQADALFLEIMEVLNVKLLERCAIYEGVHLCGWRAFRDDREMLSSS